MKLGQIPENVYKRTVIKEIQYRNDKIKNGAVTGETCAFLINDKCASVITEQKNAYIKELNGTVAIYSCVNEIDALFLEAAGININILMPHRFSEERLKLIIREYENVASELGVQIATINGEMLNGISDALISVNAVGNGGTKESAATKDNSKESIVGKDIVITKWIGMTGAGIIAANKRDELTTRFSSSYVDEMEKLGKYMSVRKEIQLLKDLKDMIVACSPVSKGGIYKSLWNMGEKLGCGLEVNLKSIPIRQETVELCNYYDLNPYELNSEGALLVVCDKGQAIVDKMLDNGIMAEVVGRITADNDRVVVNDYERKFLTKPCPDEMTKIVL